MTHAHLGLDQGSAALQVEAKLFGLMEAGLPQSAARAPREALRKQTRVSQRDRRLEAQGWGSLLGCHLWGHTKSDMIEMT